jgi:hypothetical protein
VLTEGVVRRLIGFLAAASLAACATTPGSGSVDNLRGCWIERRGWDTLTMRWFPDVDERSAWRGETTRINGGGEIRNVTLRLKRSGGTYVLCKTRKDASTDQPTCTPAYFGEAPARADEPYTEIYAGPETLRIEGRDGYATTVFDGERDGCD